MMDVAKWLIDCDNGYLFYDRIYMYIVFWKS